MFDSWAEYDPFTLESKGLNKKFQLDQVNCTNIRFWTLDMNFDWRDELTGIGRVDWEGNWLFTRLAEAAMQKYKTIELSIQLLCVAWIMIVTNRCLIKHLLSQIHTATAIHHLMFTKTCITSFSDPHWGSDKTARNYQKHFKTIQKWFSATNTALLGILNRLEPIFRCATNSKTGCVSPSSTILH